MRIIWQKVDVLPLSPAHVLLHLFSLSDSCLNQCVLRYWTPALRQQKLESKGACSFRNVWTSWCSWIPRAQPPDLRRSIKENTAWPLTVLLFIVKTLQGSAPLMLSVLAWLVSLTTKQRRRLNDFVEMKKEKTCNEYELNEQVQSIISTKI